MSKFSSLGSDVDVPKRMPIKDVHGTVIRDEQGKEAYIDFLSADSEAGRLHNRAVTQSRLQLRSGQKPTAKQLEEEQVNLLVKLARGWYLVDPATKKPIDAPFSPEDARELFSDPTCVHIKDQGHEFVHERVNFSKASSTN